MSENYGEFHVGAASKMEADAQNLNVVELARGEA